MKHKDKMTRKILRD